MKNLVVNHVSKIVSLSKEEVEKLVEIPKDSGLGDFAFPCFVLAKHMKKNPAEIAKDLSAKIKSKDFEKVVAVGPYVNFFLNRNAVADKTISDILKQRDKYGSSKEGRGKTIVIDMSSPNIAKPFGIGHLRSTIIGSAISNLYKMQGYPVKKINYLGDWGTQFGKLIVGYLKFGDDKKLNADPVKHLLDLYVRVSNDESLEQDARDWFKKLEDKDKKAIQLWKKFRALSIKDFNKIYSLLNVKFDITSGESLYNNKMRETIQQLKKKGLLEESEGAQVVNLEKYGLGVCLIEKSDGTTLYATRDITAAIDRHSRYKFEKMFYEVGAEQKLHFRQVFKILELMGYSWAKYCVHIEHGLYLGSDGKKFSTRKGKTVFMEDIINETVGLAEKEIQKREKVSDKEAKKRAKSVALAAILYGDLKNYRANDIIFDIERFLSFEGDTGPYLLYSYARAKRILEKAKYKKSKFTVKEVFESERNLILQLSYFPQVVSHAAQSLSPNIVANYAFHVAQIFNEFYHSSPVIGSENEAFRLALVDAFSQVLKNALSLLGIPVIEKM